MATRPAAGSFFFYTPTIFWCDYNEMQRRGAKFKEWPREEAYGTVAVFEDLYGNKWDLLELRKRQSIEGSAES